MDGQRCGDEERFSSYLDELASVMGRVSRIGPMRDYCTGLLLPGESDSELSLTVGVPKLRLVA